jgi:uroporphyrinogen-III synthase
MKEAKRSRVLVVRAKGQASALAELLCANALEPVPVPAIEIAPPASWCGLDAALTTLRTFDWTIFPSANAVQAFVQRARMLGLAANPRKIAAVGPATARAVEEALGQSVDLMPERYVAEALASALVPFAMGASMLLVRAAVARDVLPEALTAAGAAVTVAEAYRNVVPVSSVDALRRLFANEPPDAVAFTSGSTARNLGTLLEAAGLEMPTGMVLASIGPITSGAMRELGWEPAVEAEEATIAGLVEGLKRAFAGGRHSAPTPTHYPEDKQKRNTEVHSLRLG